MSTPRFTSGNGFGLGERLPNCQLETAGPTLDTVWMGCLDNTDRAIVDAKDSLEPGKSALPASLELGTGDVLAVGKRPEHSMLVNRR